MSQLGRYSHVAASTRLLVVWFVLIASSRPALYSLIGLIFVGINSEEVLPVEQVGEVSLEDFSDRNSRELSSRLLSARKLYYKMPQSRDTGII